MDKRRNTRLDINLEAELISDEKTFKGFIENFSSGGLGIKSAPLTNFDNIGPGDKITMKFQTNPKDVLSICYRIKWLTKHNETTNGSIYKMGMEYSLS
jgi:hypothetical protein